MNKISNNENDLQNQPLFFDFYYNEKGDYTTVNYDLPLRFSFGLELTSDELFKQFAEHIKITISTLAEFIEGESAEMMMQYSDNDLAVQNAAAIFEQISRFIGGYTTLLEMLVRDREKILAIKAINPEKSETSFNLAEHISAIMNNPDLPANLFNVIADEMAQKPQTDVYTPESVLISLQNLRDQ